MNSEVLEALCGMSVAASTLVVGDAGIEFDNGASLAIYNGFDVEALGSEGCVGKRVCAAYEFEDRIEIHFDGGGVIKIDMRDAAYNGPEALQLRIPGRPIVIWN